MPKEKKPEVKTFEVTVIAYVDRDDFTDNDGNVAKVIPDYNIGKDDVLFTGTVDLMTSDKEDTIRSKLVDVFKTRISGLSPNDLSFVKVSRKIVSTPACKEGRKWDFPQIKAINGQGKLYVRLENSHIASLADQSVSSISRNPVSLNVSGESSTSEGTEPYLPLASVSHTIDLDQPSTSGHQQIDLDQPSTSGLQRIHLNQPSTSGHHRIDLDDSQDNEALQMLFPDRTTEYLHGVRQNNITLQEIMMADGHTSMRSSSYQKYTLKKGNNDEKISKCSLLSLSGNDLIWKGDLDSFKTFVETELQINGRWSTPQGENLKFSNPEFSLKWDGEKGKMITVMQDNDENQLYTTLRSYATFTDVRVDQNLENKAEHVSNVDAEADITPHETSDSRKDSCEKCQLYDEDLTKLLVMVNEIKEKQNKECQNTIQTNNRRKYQHLKPPLKK